jgi:hypothetical protein
VTKRIEDLSRVAVAWALLVGLSLLASQLLGAQLRGFQQPHPAQQQQPGGQGNGEQKQTFEGKITKSGGKFVLEDKTNGVTYQLDDQQLAELFEGKQVKVTGTFRPESKTVYISDIELSNTEHAAGRSLVVRINDRGPFAEPVQNAFIESFNGMMRDECSNEHWFLSLAEARETIESL